MANIEGVKITDLKIIPDERGQVMHFMRADSEVFQKFGETYFSLIYPGVTKGWKLHTKSISNIAVPVGRVMFVLYDKREDSSTKGQFQNVYLGDNAYKLLTIPPGVVYAWKNLLPQTTAVVANAATEMWSPDESINLPFDEIQYDWE